MITVEHMKRIRADIESAARQDSISFEDAAREYLENVPYTSGEIILICRELQLNASEYMQYAQSLNSIEYFNSQYE